jgi:hypothetical protein
MMMPTKYRSKHSRVVHEMMHDAHNAGANDTLLRHADTLSA